MVLFLEGGEFAVAWKGLLSLVLESLLPVANEVVAESKGACGLGDGIALLGDELDRLGLELRGISTSRSRH